MYSVNNRLAEAFEKSDKSYRDISKETGIGHSTIRRYITGETEDIPMNKLALVCKSLNISVSYVMGWDDTKSNEKQIIIDKINSINDIETLKKISKLLDVVM